MTKPTLPETFQKFLLAALKRDIRIDISPVLAAERAYETAKAAMDMLVRYRAGLDGSRYTADPTTWGWQVKHGSVHAHIAERGRYKLVATRAMNELWVAQAVALDDGDVLLDEAGYTSAAEAKAACVTAAILHARGQLWRFSNWRKEL